MAEITSKVASIAAGERHVVQITDIAFGGEGVARIGEFVIFVPFVATGEKVEIEIVEAKKSFGRARLLNVLEPSVSRTTPLCRYFGDCGGCQYQHITYEEQLRIKHKQIADLFSRVGGFSHAVIDRVVACPQPYGYRNRIMVRTQWDKFKQGLNIGFIRNDNRLVVDIEECRIAEPELNAQLTRLRANPPPKGGLKAVLRKMPEGWEVPPDSFFQNNFFLLPELVNTVARRLKESGVRYLIDAYCGVGFFSVELAHCVEAFVGVEHDKQAIKAARQNAARRGLVNGEYICGQTEAHLPSLLQRFPARQTAVLLDPPRTGCPKESLHFLEEMAPAQVLYVSCHPATLARDAQILCANGRYELVRVTPLDMFPQTQHVECVADLRLKGPVPESDGSGDSELANPVAFVSTNTTSTYARKTTGAL